MQCPLNKSSKQLSNEPSNKKEENRYLHQVFLREVGVEGQKHLAKARVLCVGVGGLGSPVSLYLAAAGVGTLGLVDPDRIDLTNLQRQVLFNPSDVGQLKVEVAKKRLTEFNSEIVIRTYPLKLMEQNAFELFREYDLVVDGTDQFSAKVLINAAAARLGIPMVYGSVSGWEGQVSVFWGKHGPCFRCLYPGEPQSPVLSCSEIGVMGPVAGVMGSLQAMETIKCLLYKNFRPEGHLNPLLGRVLVFDGITMSTQVLKLSKRSNCPACSGGVPRSAFQPEIPEIKDLTWDELQIRDWESYVLLDIREKFELNQSQDLVNSDVSLKNVISWPLSEMIHREIPACLRDSENESSICPQIAEKDWVILCWRGKRSRQAIRLLHTYSLTKLFNLKGGVLSLNEPE